MAKKQGHYCKICGEHKSNESFTGKDHAPELPERSFHRAIKQKMILSAGEKWA